MERSGPTDFDDPIREKAKYYKTELLRRFFGTTASAVTAHATRRVRAASVFSCFPKHSNIVGLGFGAKLADGYRLASEEAVRVYVRTKLPKSSLSRNEFIPPLVDGVDTDVIAVGDIRTTQRPTRCGVSIGHENIMAGTLGCMVKRPGDSRAYILSNNHVLANCDSAQRGDLILEPGRMDGGDPNDPIGELVDFAPLKAGGPVEIDAAIARLFDVTSVLPEIMEIGPISQPEMDPALYQSVRKHGRTTLHTVGIVTDVDADVRVWYDRDSVDFAGQIAVEGFRGPFSAGGDSGSLIVDAVSKRPVGLLFAEGLGITFANPIGRVLNHFNVEIL